MRHFLTIGMILFVICGGCSSTLQSSNVSEKMLDFWDEAPRLFAAADLGGKVDVELNMRNRLNYSSKSFRIDRSCFKVGDFSVLYEPAKDGNKPVFGFVSSLWGDSWKLNRDMNLSFYLKSEGADVDKIRKVVLFDSAGMRAEGKLNVLPLDDGWKTVSVKLADLDSPANFNWSDVKICQFESSLPADTRLWFDYVRFEGQGSDFIGVTDKPLSQWKREAEVTRIRRIDDAMNLSARKDHFEIVSAFSKMYLNQDLDNANKILIEELNRPTINEDKWSLLHTPIYLRFYYFFSNRNGLYPGRMSAEAEKLLLETIWERTKYKNDIHWSKQSTWWLDGSENHDLNAKVCNLVSSRIFMDEPDYKDRVYPDLGYGGGYHYGKAGYYGKGINDADRHGGGRAELSDGKEYTAKDHYYAWLAFLKEYFTERAKRGFYVERASAGYTKHTFNFVELAYSQCGDQELKSIIGDFMDLFWADCAQESFGSNRGGAKSRHHKSVGDDKGGVYGLINFHLGGPGNGGCWWYYNMLNDYRMPDAVWMMMLDRQGLGSFEYKSRGIGEEENIFPRPLGAERTLLCDTYSRFLKYSYVTPDYILSTQMDHPAAVHSHLSMAGRWHGMIFAQSDAARIVPMALPDNPNIDPRKAGQADMEVMYKTAQYKNTLIVQQSRNYSVVHPTWFPSYYGRHEKPIGVWFGNDWDKLEEVDGWIFVEKGNAYAAVRVVLWDKEYEEQKKTGKGTQVFFHGAKDDPTVRLRTDCYQWGYDRNFIILEDKFSPVIIEAGRKADYPSLNDFIEAVTAGQIALYKTVVPGFDVLVYTGSAADAPEIVFNAANNAVTTFDGEHIDYSYPMTFDSPWLKSEYDSGKIEIGYGGYEHFLDFD